MKFGFTAREVGPPEAMLRGVRRAEDVGFDSCWVSEHHSQPEAGEQYWPGTLLRVAALATHTDDLEYVTSALILPLHNPFEVAEEVAVLDHLTDGQFILGVGLGYVQEEFDAFNVPMADRAGRLVEGIRILDRYLTAEDSFSFDGDIWTIDDWSPTPRPVQDPRPPILVGGWGDLALQRSIRLGDGWIAGLTADVDALARRHADLERLASDRGHSAGSLETPVMRETVVAPTREEAMALAEEYLYPVYRETYLSEDWSHPLLSVEEVTDFERLAEDRFLVGTPAEVAGGIADLREAGMTHVGCRFHFPGMPHERVVEQVELFADEVMPAV